MDLTKLNRDLAPGPNPGVLPYGSEHFGRLSSRDGETRAIASLWAQNRLTVVHGPAGAGKTSLLQAGVIPHLQASSPSIPAVGRVTSLAAFPTPSIFRRNPYTLALLSAWAPGETPVRLSGMTISDFVERQLLTQPRVMLAIDQFEELYRGPQGRHKDRDLLLDDLAKALARYKELRVLIIIRDDALADFEDSKNLMPDATFYVPGLHREGAIRAVSELVARAGRILADDAAAALAAEFLAVRSSADELVPTVTHEGFVPPTYLQLACICLRDSVPKSLTVITAVHLREYLDVDLCFAKFIGNVLIGLLQRYELDSAQLAAWLTYSFIASKDRSVEVSRAGDNALLKSVLCALEDCHILAAKSRSGSNYFELASGRLLRPLQMAVESMRFLRRSTIESAQVVDQLADATHAQSQGDLDVAERQAIAVLRRAPAGDLAYRARAETVIANVAFERGHAALSRDSYLRAAELFEAAEDSAAVGNLLAAVGRLQMIDRETAAAVSTLQSAVGRLPSDATVKVELARAFANSGEPNAAVAVLESVMTTSAHVRGDDAHILRGEILSDLGDTAGALRDLEAAESGRYPSAQAARALSLARLGRFSDAERGIGQALERGDDNGPVLLRAAQIRALRGDSTAAAVLARDAINASEPELTEYQRRQADALKDACDA
jgi:tetratricopeptide (TPR) repeat protein